jgi:dipeptidyl aminopeptidase/acylaminoacyl peptidase
VAVVNMGLHSEIVRIDVRSRAVTPLTEGEHSVQFWSCAAAADRMVFQFDEAARFGDVWTLASAGGTASRITDQYGDLARTVFLPRQERVEWKGRDGVPVEGLLFLPAGYSAGTRVPLIVQLHCGPHESDKFGFGPGVIINYVQVLTARGSAVFRPNYRGSAGYGDRFLRDVVPNYFNQMHLDVIAGVDALIARGIVDPDRVGLMGVECRWSSDQQAGDLYESIQSGFSVGRRGELDFVVCPKR